MYFEICNEFEFFVVKLIFLFSTAMFQRTSFIKSTHVIPMLNIYIDSHSNFLTNFLRINVESELWTGKGDY